MTLVLSHGDDPAPDLWMPQAAQDADLAATTWIDLRGFRSASPDARSVRSFEVERLRLAAEIIGSEIAAADLVRGWEIRNAKAQRRRFWVRSITLLIFVLLVVVLGWAVKQWVDESRSTRAALWTTLAQAGANVDPDQRLDALAFEPASLLAVATRPGYLELFHYELAPPRLEVVAKTQVSPTGEGESRARDQSHALILRPKPASPRAYSNHPGLLGPWRRTSMGDFGVPFPWRRRERPSPSRKMASWSASPSST